MRQNHSKRKERERSVPIMNSQVRLAYVEQAAVGGSFTSCTKRVSKGNHSTGDPSGRAGAWWVAACWSTFVKCTSKFHLWAVAQVSNTGQSSSSLGPEGRREPRRGNNDNVAAMWARDVASANRATVRIRLPSPIRRWQWAVEASRRRKQAAIRIEAAALVSAWHL